MLSVLSCSKIDNVPTYEDINFNITVCNPDAEPSTKALKSGWVSGDVLNIWFNTHVEYIPNLTLTYNGSTWVASKVSTAILDGLGTTTLLILSLLPPVDRTRISTQKTTCLFLEFSPIDR